MELKGQNFAEALRCPRFQSHLYGIERGKQRTRQRLRQSFNRTFMELKDDKVWDNIGSAQVSIAPLWN